MARILGAFGVRGWIKVEPFTSEADSLVAYRTWWLGTEGVDWQEHQVEQAQGHSGFVIAKLAGCEDRERAATLRGLEVAVPRSALPQAGVNEFYWADLLGLKVVTMAGEELGEVSRMLETGANDVLVVQGDRERLIPFIAEVVQQVDLAHRVIRVEWRADY